MSTDRRNFVKQAAAIAAVVATRLDAAGLARKSGQKAAIPFDQPWFCVQVGPLAGADRTITDYSGFSYCPDVNALLLFGGGHAATPEDVVLRLPMDTLVWSADYPATPRNEMLAVNADGTYKNLTAGKFWMVAGERPSLRPMSRHTYSGFIWSGAIRRMILPMRSDGASYGFSNQAIGGNGAEYDPVSRTWEDTGIAGLSPTAAYCEDPLSGDILVQSSSTFNVYDPRSRSWAKGQGGAPAGAGYAENLVYYPPNDRFYYIGRQGNSLTQSPRVWEFVYDRKTRTAVYADPVNHGPLKTNWRASPATGGKEAGYAYDSVNKLIIGGLIDGGIIFGFRPNGDGTGTWLQHPAPGTAQMTFYCIDYVPGLNTHFIICTLKGIRSTFAFRWSSSQASIPADPNVHQPTAIISPPAATLQNACDSSSDVTLSAGELRGTLACAHIRKSCSIAGTGPTRTALISEGIEGKGIIITDVDLRLDHLEIVGASSDDQNGSGVRHQGGDLTVYDTAIHHCQDGILGPAHDIPGSVTVRDCEVHDNGLSTGQAHGIYIGKIAQFTCSDSRFWNTTIGHHVKSRAKVHVIERCELGVDFDGNESYNLDLPIGGDALVTDCMLRQGPKTDNSVMLNFGSERDPYPLGTLRIYRCRFESTTGGTGIRNALANVTADIRDCTFVGVDVPVVGPHARRNCTLNGVPLPDIPSPWSPPVLNKPLETLPYRRPPPGTR